MKILEHAERGKDKLYCVCVCVCVCCDRICVYRVRAYVSVLGSQSVPWTRCVNLCVCVLPFDSVSVRAYVSY